MRRKRKTSFLSLVISGILFSIILCCSGGNNIISAAGTAKDKDRSHINLAKQGKEAFDAGDFETAAEYFSKAVEINPDYMRGLTYLGISYCMLDRKKQATDILNDVISRAPDSPDAETAAQWLQECAPVADEDCDGENCECPDGSEPADGVCGDVSLPSSGDSGISDNNICKGKKVEDLWGQEAAKRGWQRGWLDPSAVNLLTDGDVKSGLTSGYGRWGEKGDGASFDVQTALTSPDNKSEGLPAISIDLGKKQTLRKIIVSRPDQQANEGEGGAIMQISVWGSPNGKDWLRISQPFSILPGRDNPLLFGRDFDMKKPVRYIRLNFHSLGLYKWKSKVDSQIGVSEVRCYSAKTSSAKDDGSL